jgi:hypothetical protein
LSDGCGRPVAFALTPGNAHDLAGAKALLVIRCPSHKLLADRALSVVRTFGADGCLI